MKNDIFGSILLILLFIFLIIAGVISYKSIDWSVLDRIENQKITLPTQIPTNIPSTLSSTQKLEQGNN